MDVDSAKKLVKRIPEKEKNQHIQVVVRARPMNSNEKKASAVNLVSVVPDRREIIVKEKINATSTRTFTFDKVFGPSSKQTDVYEEVVVPILEEVLMGYSCTIFAYGQTGTGKTFTMEGEKSYERNFSWKDDPSSGIIPRTLHNLFETLGEQQADFTIRVSFVELYNEELFDLLTGPDDAQRLPLFDDPIRKGSVVIRGLEEVIVRSQDEVYEIMERGARKRQTAATLLNAQSSRSHSVFSITVHTRETMLDGEELLKIGKLYLVDLAGSENIGRSGAVDKRAREAGNINQSLLTLGRVITALVEHAPHVPYRESKLTRLLQDSLGGKTKTSIIATISPASTGIDETLSTLDYAFRAKNITNRPEVNQKLTKKALIKEYAEEVERLRRDLQAAREKSGFYIAEENYNMMEQQIIQKDDKITELLERVEIMQSEYEKINNMFSSTKNCLDETKQNLTETSNELKEARNDLRQTFKQLQRTTTDLDEHRYLVESHVEKEKALYSQAEQLMDVSRRATSNLNFLHGKLERKEAVEQKNLLTLQQFRSYLNGQLNVVDENLQSYLDYQAALHVKHKGEREREISNVRCALERIGENSLNQQVEFQSYLNDLNLALKEQMAIKFGNLNMQKEDISSFMNTICGNVADFCKKQNDEFIVRANSSALTINNCLNDITKLNNRHNEETLNSIDSFAVQCSGSWANFKKNLNDKRNDQALMYNNILQNFDASKKEQLKMMSDMQKINDLLNSVQTRQKRLFETHFEEIENQSVSFVVGEERITAVIEEHEEIMKKQYVNAKSVEARRCVENKSRFDELINRPLTLNLSTTKLCQKFKDKAESFSKNVEEQQTRARSELDDYVSKTCAFENSSLANNMNSIKNVVDKHQTFLRTTLSDSKAIDAAVSAVDADFQNFADDIQNTRAAFASKQQSTVQSLSTDAEMYLSEKLSSYKQTGETPARQTFTMPNKLVVTSPHETLLKRYRQDRPLLDLLDEHNKENERNDE